MKQNNAKKLTITISGKNQTDRNIESYFSKRIKNIIFTSHTQSYVMRERKSENIENKNMYQLQNKNKCIFFIRISLVIMILTA